MPCAVQNHEMQDANQAMMIGKTAARAGKCTLTKCEIPENFRYHNLRLRPVEFMKVPATSNLALCRFWRMYLSSAK